MEMPTVCRLCDTEVSLNDMVQNPLELKELICKNCEEKIKDNNNE